MVITCSRVSAAQGPSMNSFDMASGVWCLVDPLSVDIETDSVVKRVRRDGSLVRADLYDVEYSIEPGSCEIFTYSTLSK